MEVIYQLEPLLVMKPAEDAFTSIAGRGSQPGREVERPHSSLGPGLPQPPRRFSMRHTGFARAKLVQAVLLQKGRSMRSSSSLSPEGRRWIEAGKILAVDASAQVKCPVCEEDYLVVTDVRWKDGVHVDRHMQCPNCRARNVLTKLIQE